MKGLSDNDELFFDLAINNLINNETNSIDNAYSGLINFLKVRDTLNLTFYDNLM